MTRQISGDIVIILTLSQPSQSLYRYGKRVLKWCLQLHTATEWWDLAWKSGFLNPVFVLIPLSQSYNKVSTKISPLKYILLSYSCAFTRHSLWKVFVLLAGEERLENSQLRAFLQGFLSPSSSSSYPSPHLSSPQSPVISQLCPQMDIQINTTPKVSRKKADVGFIVSKMLFLLSDWIQRFSFHLLSFHVLQTMDVINCNVPIWWNSTSFRRSNCEVLLEFIIMDTLIKNGFKVLSYMLIL